MILLSSMQTTMFVWSVLSSKTINFLERHRPRVPE